MGAQPEFFLLLAFLMKRIYLTVLVSIPVTAVAGAGSEMAVGDGQIDGRKIKPFEITWQQCAFVDDQWTDQGAVTETLTILGDSELRLRRAVKQPGGKQGASATYFDRASFAPIRMETEIAGADGTRLAYSHRDIDVDGYAGVVDRGGEKKSVQGEITSSMLDGGSLGLPLATIAYQEKPLEFLASMMSFDASYRVKAEWVGSETLDFEGNQVEAWLIDIEWHHEVLGDVYPPGPDASGGRYWVVPDPPDGFPYVPRYKTDSYAVEFIRKFCPRTEG